MRRPTRRRFARLVRLAATTLLATALLAADARDVRAQTTPQAPNATALGLAAAGAFGVSAGGTWVERGASGLEGSARLDLGHFASPRLRLLASASFLRSFPYEERVETEGETYRDVFYDLSGDVAVSFYGAAPAAVVNPYVSAGVGIHVLSSSFGSLLLDQRYNTNNFGFLGAAGVHVKVGAARKRAAFLEVRRVQAKDASRVSVHVGVLALFNDLARR